MRISLRSIVAVLAVLLAIPVADASARSFTGKTSQGGGVLVKTDATGKVASISIGWRAFCGHRRGSVPSSTLISAPFDRGSSRGFYNAGTYQYRGRRGARNYVKTRVRGTRLSGRRWKGLFGVRITIKRKGKVLYRCRSMRMHWSVKRRR